MSSKVFVSYRRAENAFAASLLGDRIKAKHPGVEVFLDTDSMPAGNAIGAVIEAKVSQSDAVLILIGSQWLSLTDADGPG